MREATPPPGPLGEVLAAVLRDLNPRFLLSQVDSPEEGLLRIRVVSQGRPSFFVYGIERPWVEACLSDRSGRREALFRLRSYLSRQISSIGRLSG